MFSLFISYYILLHITDLFGVFIIQTKLLFLVLIFTTFYCICLRHLNVELIQIKKPYLF